MGCKTFLDTVHGYITVPSEYCKEFVDTENFQRLRRIEQLSSRSLFPCARHDRFVHSLGVYHIGKQILKSARKTCEAITKEQEVSFQIACLLHDVGHSPFSHTLENLFGTVDDLFQDFKAIAAENRVNDDFGDVDLMRSDVKPHEILSALLCITTYKEGIVRLGGSPSLVSRMIMGFSYRNLDKSLDDCLISLLHGDVIDADKIDYICRDKWASGYQSNSVDIDRIIRALRIIEKEGKFQIAYSKIALYEINALIDNKNFQANWIFKHHQVVYEQKIFLDAVKSLVGCLFKDPAVPPSKIFDYHSFFRKVDVCEGCSVYMLSDDDIIHLMKSHRDEIPTFNEWLSRKYNYKPLWKTYSEMIALLGNVLSARIMTDKGGVYDDIVNMIKDKYKVNVFSLDSTPKIKSIQKGQILISFGDTICDFTELGLPPKEDVYAGRTFKYIFIDRTLFEDNPVKQKQSILDDIRHIIFNQ